MNPAASAPTANPASPTNPAALANPGATVTVGGDADLLLDIATGYMAAKQLFTAVEVGLFAALASAGMTAEQLSDRLRIPLNGARILADSMNSVGLLDRVDGVYSNAPAAQRYLAGHGGLDLGPFFTFLGGVSYPHWRQFGDAARTGTHPALDLGEFPPSAIGAGIGAFQRLHAEQFAANIDLAGRTRLLDLGGQSPLFAIEAMRRNPALATDFVYQPGEEAMVQAALAEAGLADRATVGGAPTVEAQPPDGHDAVLLNHCIHRFTPAENCDILANVRLAADTGALLAIVDFIADDDPRQRRIDAMHAAEYLVIDSTVAHPLAEIRTWLAETGWDYTDVVALPGSPRVVLARAA